MSCPKIAAPMIVAELMLGSATMPARMEKTACTPPPGPPADFDEPAKGKATSALSASECTASRDRLLVAIRGCRQRRSHHEQDEPSEIFRYCRRPATRSKSWVGAYV